MANDYAVSLLQVKSSSTFLVTANVNIPDVPTSTTARVFAMSGKLPVSYVLICNLPVSYRDDTGHLP